MTLHRRKLSVGRFEHPPWFYDYVLSAYSMGLINGRTETTYDPYGELSYAEAVKLAVCMYEIYTTVAVKTGNSSGSTWYLNNILSALSCAYTLLRFSTL